jgi:hypothetical protein
MEFEPEIVAGGIEVTLAGLRELLYRIEHQQLEAGDWPLFEALVAEELDAREADEDASRLVVDADESTRKDKGWTSADARAPSRVEPRSLSGGARRRG